MRPCMSSSTGSAYYMLEVRLKRGVRVELCLDLQISFTKVQFFSTLLLVSFLIIFLSLLPACRFLKEIT